MLKIIMIHQIFMRLIGLITYMIIYTLFYFVCFFFKQNDFNYYMVKNEINVTIRMLMKFKKGTLFTSLLINFYYSICERCLIFV